MELTKKRDGKAKNRIIDGEKVVWEKKDNLLAAATMQLRVKTKMGRKRGERIRKKIKGGKKEY